jgi:hypothetical protein
MEGGYIMIVITFLDGNTIEVDDNTTLIGINNLPPKDHEECFYLQQQYVSLVDNGLRLSTVDPRLGITGFILSHDCFSIGTDEFAPIYLKTAVKSISVK